MATRARVQLVNDFQTIDIFLAPDRPWEQKLFSLSELIPTTLTFFGPGKLTLETEIMPEDSILIQDFIPGRYALVWEMEEGRAFEAFFEIHPHSLSFDHLSQMFEALEQKIPGLTQNPDFNKAAYRDLAFNHEEYLKLMFFAKHSQELLIALSYIEKRPVQSLYQEYETTSVSRRPTSKSQRYAATRGQVGAAPVYYEPVKKLTLDTPENRYLKYMLGHLKETIQPLSRLAKDQEMKILSQMKEVRAQNASLRQNLSLLGNRNFSKSYADWNGRLIQGEMEESRLDGELDSYREKCDPLLELDARLNLLLETTWLAAIPELRVMGFSRNMVKYRGYQDILQLFQVLQSNDLKSRFQYPRHQTSKLFEFYALLLCHELLVGNKLRPKKSITAIYSEAGFDYVHPSGCSVRLSYDKTVADVASARQSGTAQLVSLIGSRRPDVLLELFCPNGEFLAAMVVEVKYRRLKHIYQEGLDTDVTVQLNAYSMFAHFEPDKPLKRHLPIEVCALYPQYGDARFVKDEVLGYDFIPVVPTHFQLTDPQFAPLSSMLKRFLQKMPAP